MWVSWCQRSSSLLGLAILALSRVFRVSIVVGTPTRCARLMALLKVRYIVFGGGIVARVARYPRLTGPGAKLKLC